MEFDTPIGKTDFDPDERTASRVWLSVSPEDYLPQSGHCRALLDETILRCKGRREVRDRPLKD